MILNNLNQSVQKWSAKFTSTLLRLYIKMVYTSDAVPHLASSDQILWIKLPAIMTMPHRQKVQVHQIQMWRICMYTKHSTYFKKSAFLLRKEMLSEGHTHTHRLPLEKLHGNSVWLQQSMTGYLYTKVYKLSSLWTVDDRLTYLKQVAY